MPKAKVMYNDVVLAESANTVIVEGNHYFPPEDVNMGLLIDSSARQTVCPWKGTASYYDISVNGETVEAAAWVYPQPRSAAERIRDHIAFYKARVAVTEF